MSTKTKYEHKDKLGLDLQIDDLVAFPVTNSLEIGKITKLNPKQLTLQKSGRYKGIYHKYPVDVIKLDSNLALIYLLKES
jgi:hypothetical protein